MYFYISTGTNRPREINAQYMSGFCTENCLKFVVDGKLQCKCGEENDIFHWCWMKEHNGINMVLSNDNRDVLFHPVYSSGTAALRGNAPFQQNLHYYWEIKMISSLYGTDVMVGIGTSKVVLSNWKFRFCSMLGIDSQSWGYSYHGNIQHNKLVRKYGTKYGFGSLVGVHLDMYTGTLEYYLNRKPLGIAFDGLKNFELYPMVSSTAAQSALRMTCAIAEESTLQMICLKFITKYPNLYKQYREIPGLTRQYDKKYFWIVPVDHEAEAKRKSKIEEDLMCPLQYSNFCKRKNFRSIRWIPPERYLNLDGFLSDSDCDLPSDVLEEVERRNEEEVEEPSTSNQNDCDANFINKKVRRTVE